MNNLHSSYQKDEKEKEMEKIKYRRGKIVDEDETENEKIEISLSRMRQVSDVGGNAKVDDKPVHFDKRAGGEFEGKAFYLSDLYDWVLCKDALNTICLIPLKKETD